MKTASARDGGGRLSWVCESYLRSTEQIRIIQEFCMIWFLYSLGDTPLDLWKVLEKYNELSNPTEFAMAGMDKAECSKR